MTVLERLDGIQKTSLFGTAVHAVAATDAVAAADLEALLRSRGLNVIAIDRVAPSLEDVFLDIVDGESRRRA